MSGILLSDFTAALIGGTAALSLCCGACIFAEVRQCRRLWEEDRELRRHQKLNGLHSGPLSDAPIELIGSRPHDERPQGVDWTISMWASQRGQYDPENRGYGSKHTVHAAV